MLRCAILTTLIHLVQVSYFPVSEFSIFLFFIEVWLTYSVLLAPCVQQLIGPSCTLPNVHHKGYRCPLSPYSVVRVLLTVFPVLYLSSLRPLCYINGVLYPLIPFLYFTDLLPHLPSGHHQFSVLKILGFCFFFPFYKFFIVFMCFILMVVKGLPVMSFS